MAILENFVVANSELFDQSEQLIGPFFGSSYAGDGVKLSVEHKFL